MERLEITTMPGRTPADFSRAGALLLFLLGIGLCVAPVAAALLLRWMPWGMLFFVWKLRPRKKRMYAGAVLVAVFAIFLLFCRVDVGAEAGLGVLFFLIFYAAWADVTKSTLPVAEKTALGLAAFAAMLLALTLFRQAGKIHFIDCSGLLGGAVIAGALTLALRPKRKVGKS